MTGGNGGGGFGAMTVFFGTLARTTTSLSQVEQQEPIVEWKCGRCNSSYKVAQRYVGYCQACMKMGMPAKQDSPAAAGVAALTAVAAELAEKNPQVTRRFSGLIFNDKKQDNDK